MYDRAVREVFFLRTILLRVGYYLGRWWASFAELRRRCISPDSREDNPGSGVAVGCANEAGTGRTSEAVCDGMLRLSRQLVGFARRFLIPRASGVVTLEQVQLGVDGQRKKYSRATPTFFFADRGSRKGPAAPHVSSASTRPTM